MYIGVEQWVEESVTQWQEYLVERECEWENWESLSWKIKMKGELQLQQHRYIIYICVYKIKISIIFL